MDRVSFFTFFKLNDRYAAFVTYKREMQIAL